MIEIIDKVTNTEVLERAVKRYREKGIILPTFKQMEDPTLIPEKIVKQLKSIGLWDNHPLNLFRITWKNEPVETGGGFGGVNYMEIPKEITGVDAKRVMVLERKLLPRR